MSTTPNKAPASDEAIDRAIEQTGKAMMELGYFANRYARRHPYAVLSSIALLLVDGVAWHSLPTLPWQAPLGLAAAVVLTNAVWCAKEEQGKPHVHSVSFQRALEHAGLLDSTRYEAPQLRRINTLPSGDVELIVSASVPELVWQQPQVSNPFCGAFGVKRLRRVFRDNTNQIHLILDSGDLGQVMAELNELFREFHNHLRVPLGKTDNGMMVWDIVTTPHVVFAGSTGSGKSTIIRLIMAMLLAADFDIFLIDPKQGLDFSFALSSLALPLASNAEEALPILDQLWDEHLRRTQLLRDVGYSSLHEAHEHGELLDVWDKFLICDELAVFSLSSKEKAQKELAQRCQTRLEQIGLAARATGIHLCAATQYPTSDILGSQLRQQLRRFSGRLEDDVASKLVLGIEGAEQISSDTPGRFLTRESAELVEFQTYYFSSSELSEFLR